MSNDHSIPLSEERIETLLAAINAYRYWIQQATRMEELEKSMKYWSDAALRDDPANKTKLEY